MTARTLIHTYNRRRSRIHPIDDCELSMQATKPKLSSGVKPGIESQSKILLVSENVSEWPSIKDTRTSSLELDCEDMPSIFRQRADLDDAQENMFELKRANPVYDSDDEDFVTSLLSSPTKKQRTCLNWENRLSTEESGGLTWNM